MTIKYTVLSRVEGCRLDLLASQLQLHLLNEQCMGLGLYDNIEQVVEHQLEVLLFFYNRNEGDVIWSEHQHGCIKVAKVFYHAWA